MKDSSLMHSEEFYSLLNFFIGYGPHALTTKTMNMSLIMGRCESCQLMTCYFQISCKLRQAYLQRNLMIFSNNNCIRDVIYVILQLSRTMVIGSTIHKYTVACCFSSSSLTILKMSESVLFQCNSTTLKSIGQFSK